MWTTPLVQSTSAIVTWTLLVSPAKVTVPATDKSTVRLWPSKTVGNNWSDVKSDAKARILPITWYIRTSRRALVVRPSTTLLMAANASFVGAKTVNGPEPSRVFTRSAVTNASTKDDRVGAH